MATLYNEYNISYALDNKFAIFTSSKLKFLEKIADIPVYRLNKHMFPQLQQYSLLGDIILSFPKTYSILLVSNKISSHPYDYKKVLSLPTINIWKPIHHKKYKRLGLVASTTKPDLKLIKVVEKKYCTKKKISKALQQKKVFPMNKYNMMNISNLSSYCINDTDSNSTYSKSWTEHDIIANDSNLELDDVHENIKVCENYFPWYANNLLRKKYIPENLTKSKTKTNSNAFFVYVTFFILVTIIFAINF